MQNNIPTTNDPKPISRRLVQPIVNKWMIRFQSQTTFLGDTAKLTRDSFDHRRWKQLLANTIAIPAPMSARQSRLRRRSGRHLILASIGLFAMALVFGIAHGGIPGVLLFICGAAMSAILAWSGWMIHP